MPDFSIEDEVGGIVAGVDEAGRGPLAGPVVAAAVILDPARLASELAAAIDDSKRLSAATRLSLFAAITAVARIGVGAAAVAVIDRDNILRATLTAMARAVARLGPVPDLVLVDGNRGPSLPCRVRCVVGGDKLSLSIAAASIVAKVMRDRIMGRLALRYPVYGWERNAGYATARHRAALFRFGPTPHHRQSFAPVRSAIIRADPNNLLFD